MPDASWSPDNAEFNACLVGNQFPKEMRLHRLCALSIRLSITTSQRFGAPHAAPSKPDGRTGSGESPRPVLLEEMGAVPGPGHFRAEPAGPCRHMASLVSFPGETQEACVIAVLPGFGQKRGHARY